MQARTWSAVGAWMIVALALIVTAATPGWAKGKPELSPAAKESV